MTAIPTDRDADGWSLPYGVSLTDLPATVTYAGPDGWHGLQLDAGTDLETGRWEILLRERLLPPDPA